MNRGVYGSVAACVALASFAIPASAGDVACAPNLGAVTIEGNVTVTQTCQLDGTTVKGNILLYAGGSLVARDVRLEGNVQAEQALSVDLERSQVTGSVQLDGLTGELARVVDNEIVGNIQVSDSRARIEVMANQVGADVQAFANLGGVRVQDNVIDGNLQCKQNAPAPLGGNNQVSGNKEDQCANLQSVATPPAPGGDPGTPGGGTIQGDVNCPPHLGAVTVDGNVLVTAACSLEGTRVKGNVLLYSGGSLVARDALIDGNVQAEFANSSTWNERA
jgi:cytoskeletal protein CcmA (bactofilin family)